MNRKELCQKNWIPLKKRLPPDSTKEILIWNPILKKALIIESYIARFTGEAILKKEEYVTPDRIYNNWCLIFGPIEKRK